MIDDSRNLLEVFILVVSVATCLAGISAAIWAVGKVKGVETTLDLLASGNDALRSANEDLRVELVASERHCAERLSRLEGQNEALLNGLSDKLAVAIAEKLDPALRNLATRLVNSMSPGIKADGESTRQTVHDEGTTTRAEIHARAPHNEGEPR